MVAFAESKTRDLIWRFPEQEGRPFVLRAGETELAWLDFHEQPAASLGGFDATRLLFHYTTNLHPRVTISSEQDPSHVVAQFLPCWTGGGWVSFDSGACYRWKKSHLWGSTWCFSRQGEESSVCLSQQAGALIEGGKVRVCCGALDRPETRVLLLLAWFLRIMDFEMLVEGVFRVG